MFKQAIASGQSHQSGLHCSRTCAKWAYIRHILSVNAQMSLIVCAVLPEPSLLSHMHKMGVHMTYFAYFSVNARTRISMHVVLPEPSLRSYIHKMGVFMHILSVKSCQQSSLLHCGIFSHMSHKMLSAQNGLTYDIFFSQCSDEN